MTTISGMFWLYAYFVTPDQAEELCEFSDKEYSPWVPN